MAKRITLQDVFNAGWLNFVVGKKKPSRRNGTCVYRSITDSGEERRCIVGWTLPSKVLDVISPNVPVSDLFDDMPELFDSTGILTVHRKSGDKYVPTTVIVTSRIAINEAQRSLHDVMCTANGEWSKRYDIKKVYEEFAKKYNLKIPGVKPVSKALSLQAIFSAAWKRFIVNNGKPAVDKHGDCVYYDPNNKNRCAIGAAFNLNQIRELDKHASTTGDSASALMASQVVEKFPQWFDMGAMSESDFGAALDHLQLALHDSALTPSFVASNKRRQWLNKKSDRVNAYKKYAEKYGLQIPVTPKKRKTK